MREVTVSKLSDFSKWLDNNTSNLDGTIKVKVIDDKLTVMIYRGK